MNELRRIAVLNRGEPAVRFIRALREYNLVNLPPGTPPIQVVALYTTPDADAPFVRMADDAACLGPPLLPTSGGASISAYCHHDRVLQLLLELRCDAVWPGWGFASEDPSFVDRLDQAGITFIGPPAEAMRRLGDKIASKQLAEAAGVPLAPWRLLDPEAPPEDALEAAHEVGFPLMVKASAGGGGRGIRRVDHPSLLLPAVRAAADEVRRVFGQGGLFIERCVERARHIEVQLLANHTGRAFAVGVRDCSIQRRNQKVIEEAPSPILPAEVAESLQASSVRLAELAGYRSAGTAEFLYDPATGQACFLEVNARLQVEHTITEAIAGVDLVHAQLDVARGVLWEPPTTPSRGCAIEVRLNAENPEEGFTPSPGLVRRLRVPAGPGVRVDSGIAEGMAIPPDFDSMIAKVIAWAPTRPLAIARLTRALQELEVVLEDGATNKAFLLDLLEHPAYRDATAHTAWIDEAIRAGDFGRPQGELQALVAAAVLAWKLQRHAEIQRFFAQAQNGIPQHLRAPEPSTHELRLRGRAATLQVFERDEHTCLVRIDDHLHPVAIEPLGPHAATLVFGGQRHQLLYAWGRAGIAVEVDGAMHHVERASGGTVRAPAPAVVVHVHTQPGQRVAIGDRLCTLEAMKMETAVFAQEAGVVREVLISPNQQVTAGQPIVLLDPEEDAGQAAAQAAPPERFPAPAPSLGDRLFAQGLGFLDTLEAPQAAQAVEEALETLRASLLGYEAPESLLGALEGLLASAPDLREPARALPLLELLSDAAAVGRIFADEAPDASADPHAPSTLAAFFDFARQHHDGPEALSAPMQALLTRALAPYGVSSLEPTDALRAALWRMAVTRAWPEARRAFTSLLLRLAIQLHGAGAPVAEVAGLREVLSALAALHVEGASAVVADNARHARYLIFERPRMAARQRRLDTWASDMLQRVYASDEDEEAVHALAAAHHPLLPALLREPSLRGEGAAAEVLLYRLYIGRALRRVSSRREAALRVTGFRVEVGPSPLHVTLVEAPAASWRDALASLPALAGPGRLELALHGPPPEELPGALLAAVQGLSLPAETTHLTATWAEPSGAIRHRTWRAGAEGLVENPVLRDVHPEVARRLELRRLDAFHLERLAASEYIYAFRARAKDNPRDERIFVAAELRFVPDAGDSGEELAEFRSLYSEALAALRAAQARDGKRLHWNRLTFFVRPTIHLNAQGVELLATRLLGPARGLGLEKVVIRARVHRDEAPGGSAEVEYVVRLRSHTQLEVTERAPETTPIAPVSSYEARVVTARRLRCAYPFEVIRMLEGRTQGQHLPDGITGGSFQEFDLAPDGERLVPVERPHGQNACGVVVGLITHRTAKVPEGMTRVWIASDPTAAMGALAEPECRRIIAALELASSRGLPVEWLPISSGARIAMDSGTENLDWTARVLQRIIEFTQQRGEINIIVDGINVGAQSYWNAEATMLMHTRGLLIMTPRGSMVLTGRKALEFSGGVAAEDERGIGGLERVMGPNGQAQIAARDLGEAYAILFAHYRYTFKPAGEPGPRRQRSADPAGRSVLDAPYEARFGEVFRRVGEIFDRATNPDRKLPFAIREVMRAVIDADGGHLERFAAMRHAEMAVVWDAHLGGQPVCLVGIESRPIARHGRVPMDGPDTWTGGTLFPQSSRKVARALNAASGNRPAVVLANLSGFDGSPESLRRLQLEYGAEIGRAVVNFEGPLIFVVIGRYHGGAYVVFSRALNPNLQAFALEGSFASVIGGAPAAAVVFPRDVQRRVDRDPRLVAAREALQAAPEGQRPALRDKLDKLAAQVLLEKRGEVAREFDAIHSVERAVRVGSLDAVITPERLRPAIIEALERSAAWGRLAPEAAAAAPAPEPRLPSSPSVASRPA